MLFYYWSSSFKKIFKTQRKLIKSRIQKSQKLSAREFPSTVKSQKFSLAKLKCYTVKTIRVLPISTKLKGYQKCNELPGILGVQ